MTSILFSPQKQSPYSDTQTGSTESYSFRAARVDEVASEPFMISNCPAPSGAQIRAIGKNSFEAQSPCEPLADGKGRYPIVFLLMARLGAAMIVLGLILGYAKPGPVTGAILPVGLLLFAITGWLARRQDRVGN